MLLYDHKIELNAVENFDGIDISFKETTFSGMFINDWFTKVVKIIICTWLILYFLITLHSDIIIPHCKDIMFILTACLGSFFAISADDFRMLFLGLEFLSISSIIFIKMNELPDKKGVTISIFIAYGMGAGLILLGCSMLYGAYGITDISLIGNILQRDRLTLVGSENFSILPFALIVFGLFAKMLFFPFHGLYIEFAEKTMVHSFVFIDFLPRITCIATIIRLHSVFNLQKFSQVLLAIACLSMILSAGAMLRQNQIKNILSFNSVVLTGAMLAGFAVSFINAVTCVFFMLIMATVAMLIFLGSVLHVQSSGRKVLTLHDLSFVSAESTVAAAALAFCILSLVGLPPFPGFIPFVIFVKNTIIESAYVTLAFAVLAKLIEIIVGIKVIISLIAKRDGCAINPVVVPSTHGTVAVASITIMSVFLVFLMIEADGVINILSLAEAVLRCYE
jgi:NADH-quinone oxidoreductase subunit N